MKVLEDCNTIVASSLEQTSRLRKNFQVRMTQTDAGTQSSDDDISSDYSSTSNLSTTAIRILADHAAKLIDILYNIADEKDRILGISLQNLLNNIMPYVHTHVASNATSYRSASTLLMNLSQYSYLKKTWKKEVLEQLFDVGFFQVDSSALNSWKIIISNMINDEKSISFRDVMNKINAVQIGLLVSKEQEYEQRAMLIKRLSFVIYACDKDLCNRYIPELLECIADALKLPQVPILYIQIYLFFRVLLIKISRRNLNSLWPILISELIQILLHIEQGLSSSTDGDIK